MYDKLKCDLCGRNEGYETDETLTLCTPCWELEHRMMRYPELVIKVLRSRKSKGEIPNGKIPNQQ